MKSVRKWIRDLFGFSATEINGFVILVPLLIVLLSTEPLYHGWIASREEHITENLVVLDSMLASWTPAPSARKVSGLFSFDPNTASVEELQRLGIADNLAKRIAAYRSKGGVFRTKADLLKIYGLDSTLYKQLYTHIEIPAKAGRDARPTSVYVEPRVENRSSESRKSKTVTSPFNVNTADTLLLKSVYGIGSRLAARIIRFRESLGGFVGAKQLYEVYGLDSVVVERLQKASFIEKDFKPQRININRANEKELSAHPYIRFKLARLLVSYRFQHGDFIAVEDIKKLSAIEPAEIERLLPYLKVDEEGGLNQETIELK